MVSAHRRLTVDIRRTSRSVRVYTDTYDATIKHTRKELLATFKPDITKLRPGEWPVKLGPEHRARFEREVLEPNRYAKLALPKLPALLRRAAKELAGEHDTALVEAVRALCAKLGVAQ
jgi:hypothetical protein